MDTVRHTRTLPAVNRRTLVGAGIAAPAVMSAITRIASAQDATPAASPAASENAAVLAEHGKDMDALIDHGSSFEMDMLGMEDFLTPNDTFFVRANGPMAVDVAPEDWRLSVTGLVENELELTIDDLKAMENHTITAFVECSGNSRSRFSTTPEPVSGTAWGNGGIGNAEWTGVMLKDILAEAGVQDGVVELISQGGDFEDMRRGLPIGKALEDCMIVWDMNGEPIPNPNGGPLRLLVPNWGGIASTKWIVGLELVDTPFDGHFNTESYVIVDTTGAVVRPVREMGPKSVITSHGNETKASAGAQTVGGFAWSGYGQVTRVEISLDGGKNWTDAEITQEAGPASWVRFEYEWDAQAGETVLLTRATDQRLITQPANVPWNAKGYLMNAMYPVHVTVE